LIPPRGVRWAKLKSSKLKDALTANL
jgi:hypothetical protein